jgi:MFS family permease
MFSKQYDLVRGFKPSIRFFLISTFLADGIAFNLWLLFFNFFILERGFSREFLGLVNSAPSIAALVLGLPLGFLSDRIGRKKAMMIGIGSYAIASVIEITTYSPGLILIAAFIGGAGHTLYFLSQAPFMANVTSTDNRTLLFSLNFGLVSLSGLFANLIGGQLPAFFGNAFGFPLASAQAYQAVLIISIFVSLCSLVPLAYIRETSFDRQDVEQGFLLSGFSETLKKNGKALLGILSQPTSVKLALPNIFLGFGAALLIPYINVFLRDKFQISDQLLGLFFSLSALVTGVSVFLGPLLAKRSGGKIRAITITQGSSLFFLLMLGFSNQLTYAAIGFLARNALMNMAVPLFDAFAMEQIPQRSQGTVNSLRELSWQMGWAIGPYVSGVVQGAYGFSPLFIVTAVLYAFSTILIWIFFSGSEQVLSTKITTSAVD